LTIEYEPIRPPRRLDALRELRLPLDALRWVPSWFARSQVRAVQPRTVILLPGFGTGPRSMRVIEAFLRRRGHRVRDWGLGVNDGNARRLRSLLTGVVDAAVQQHAEPVVLVGWSLGGYLAREFARDQPHRVRGIVTLGSPVVGGPRYTATAERYRSQGYDLDAIERSVKDRYATPLKVPVTAVYSKRDGIVAWPACIDHWSPAVHHVEVSETHLGLVLSPRVFRIVAEAIEQDQAKDGLTGTASRTRPAEP
jgi:pimeloyl-ACP methyl ester carboxylesterase